MPWDNWGYQDSLVRRIENATRYRGEHLDRIRRGQSNGSRSMVGEKSAEIAVLNGLLGGNIYRTPADILARLKQMRDTPPSVDATSQEEADGFKRGWGMTIREEMTEMESQL